MATIEITGDAGIKTVRHYHEILAEALSLDEELILDLSQVKNLDLSMVQLLIEAGREARRNSRVLKLRSVNHDIRKQLEICGVGG